MTAEQMKGLKVGDTVWHVRTLLSGPFKCVVTRITPKTILVKSADGWETADRFTAQNLVSVFTSESEAWDEFILRHENQVAYAERQVEYRKDDLRRAIELRAKEEGGAK